MPADKHKIYKCQQMRVLKWRIYCPEYYAAHGESVGATTFLMALVKCEKRRCCEASQAPA